jgi:signal transduction histidine kinase
MVWRGKVDGSPQHELASPAPVGVAPKISDAAQRNKAAGRFGWFSAIPAGPRLPAAAQAPPWLPSALLATVAILFALTLITTFFEPMPESHRVYVPVALVPIVIAWLAEIFGLRWSRSLFAIAVAAPNIALSALGHVGANYLFLLLLVAWLAYAGTRNEGLFALGLSLIAVGTVVAVTIADGGMDLTAWVVWTLGLFTIWIAARMIRAQQALLSRLRLAQADLDRKAREAEALSRADEQLYRSLHLDTVLQAVVDAVTDILQADKCALMVWDPELQRLVGRATSGFRPDTVERMTYAPGEGIAGIVFERGAPVAVEDTLGDPRVKHEVGDPEGIRSVVSLPIYVGGEVFGVFGVNYCAPRTFSEADIQVFQSLAQRAEMAIGNARLYDQAQRVATLEERQRLARDLHDSATQSMYSARMYAEAASRLLSRGDEHTAAEYLGEVKAATRDALTEMRLLIHELRPPILESEGLIAALRLRLSAVEERAGIETVLDVAPGFPERLPVALEKELYSLAQEALNNALKHGRPERITLALAETPSGVSLEVSDDGAGFDPEQIGPNGGNGLRGMRERVARHGGVIRIESAPGEGARLRVEVPR